MGLVTGYEEWFGMRRTQRQQVSTPKPNRSVSSVKLKEAVRLLYQIERSVADKVEEIKAKSGEETFERAMSVRLEITGQMSTERIIDKILATAGAGAEKIWTEYALKYLALATVLRDRIRTGI